MRAKLQEISFVFLVVGLLSPLVLYGQGGATGAISGTVVAVYGWVVAEADVQIINSSMDVLVRSQSTATDG